MKYKHILVAIDLDEVSASKDTVISRSVSLAKDLDAELSFVHVDKHHLENELLAYDKPEAILLDEKYRELRTELKTLHAKLDILCESIDYPISNKLVLEGEVKVKLVEAVKNMNADLLVCGHHHDFWSRWWSSAHKLLDLTVVDLMLIRI